MPKGKCAIYLLSGRPWFLESCLESVWEHYNSNFRYPIFVYYFDSVISSRLRRRLTEKSHTPIRFVRLRPKVPSHISKAELFYNRQNAYAQSFGRERINYLHMEHFVSNLLELPELADFDTLHRIDDDALLKAEIEGDLAGQLQKTGRLIGTSHTYNNVTQRHLDTRERLFEFVVWYTKSRKISAKHELLASAIETNNESQMHSLPWTSGNFNVYNMEKFRTAEFADWITAVNQFGGPYKHRWGDQEVLGLFGYFHHENPVLDFGLRDRGLYDPRRPSTEIIRSGSARWWRKNQKD